tara:strand:- start:358 stop:729 length:372 start_codon:yes stop_codon:yes gene_type:complete
MIWSVSIVWLKKTWEWCKIHWKFLLGISIPIVVSILLRKGNTVKIYKKAAEAKKSQLNALQQSHDLETKKKQEAQSEFINSVNKINLEHEEVLKKLAKAEQEKINKINTAEEATEAIKERLKK